MSNAVYPPKCVVTVRKKNGRRVQIFFVCIVFGIFFRQISKNIDWNFEKEILLLLQIVLFFPDFRLLCGWWVMWSQKTAFTTPHKIYWQMRSLLCVAASLSSLIFIKYLTLIVIDLPPPPCLFTCMYGWVVRQRHNGGHHRQAPHLIRKNMCKTSWKIHR